MFATHWSDTLIGRVFSQAISPLGAALPLYTVTAAGDTSICGLPLWNPPGSNRNVELISVDMPWVSGTAAFSAIGLMVGQLNSIGSATGCSLITPTVPQSGMLNSTSLSKCVSSNSLAATNFTVTAGTAAPPVLGTPGAGWSRTLFSINLENSTTTPEPTSLGTYLFNGTAVLPPGVFIYLAATKATVALFAPTLVWKEIPINPSAG